MIWNIVADSSCDLKDLHYKDEHNEIRFYSVPFILTVGNRDFIDDAQINVDELMDAMELEQRASKSSCPSPQAWLEHFEKEGNVIAVAISKELSGSYNSACVAREMLLEKQSDKKIAVINSYSASAGLVHLVRTILENIRAGQDFDEVVQNARHEAAETQTIFALCSFNNLVKNGRMSHFAGFIAKRLGFWGIGAASPEGKIDIKGKVRGTKKALQFMLDEMRSRKPNIRSVTISHCQNSEMASLLKDYVKQHWNDAKTEINETKGLCSYYAERNGLIVAYA